METVTKCISTIFIFFADFGKNIPLSRMEKGMKLFVWFAEISIGLAPPLQFILLMYRPCSAPFLLSMFPGCHHTANSGFSLYLKLILHSFETWMAWHLLFSGAVSLFHEFWVGIVCILHYFRIF